MATKPFPVMIDMAQSPEEILGDSAAPCCDSVAPKGPRYPYELRIALTEKELTKLGLSHEAATIGGMFHGHFMARITSVNLYDHADGQTCRVEAQIESLAIESEDAENEDVEASETPRKRGKLYG